MKWPLTGLSQLFSQLFEDADDYDIIIKVGEDPNKREFRAHSNILRVRSPYFKRALSQDLDTDENNMFNFTKSNISPTVFEMIIRFMYTGILDLREHLGSTILDILVASDELLIEEKDSNSRIPKDIECSFNLIYLGSRDGYDINNIRSKCNGHKTCILVIKIAENDTIICGYNPIGWKYNVQNQNNSNRDYWVNTTESYIFSLGDGNDLNNFKISRVVNSKYAIYESNYQSLPLSLDKQDELESVLNKYKGTGMA
ncbi:9260_t:CDS:2 [Funneliformis geosporum]|uniref:9260_t:CDS:1 n=1 Tax=Funneliformis geosporum TaxID=1117311 RepID=A0A9W4WUQ9_9GLOM|nr:9260_t:CDS:2 [Funneliformis geosporum]